MYYAMGITLNELEDRINYIKGADMDTYSFMKAYYGIKDDIETALEKGIISRGQAERLEDLLDC